MSETNVRLIRYASLAEAAPLRNRWDALVERLGGDLFTSFDWCAVWWKHFGHERQLELFAGHVGDQLVAVLPLFRDKIAWWPLSLRVIRIVGCDHCVTTCNVAIDPRWLEPVVQALILTLDKGGSWDLIHLGELPGYSRDARLLAEAFQRCRRNGDVLFSDDDYPHMTFDLPSTFDEYLASLSVKERRNVRRDERQLERQGTIERRQPTDGKQLAQALANLISLHTPQWARLGRLGHFGDWPQIEAFHRDIGERLLLRGRLAFVELLTNGEVVASEYGARFGKRVHWIIGGRRQDLSSRPGFCALVQATLEAGATQIDALPGYYNYKRRLGACVLGVKTITLHSTRGLSRCRTGMVRRLIWVIDVLYFRIWFWRLAPWIRTRYPKFRGGSLSAGLWRRYVRSRFLVAAKRKPSRVS